MEDVAWRARRCGVLVPCSSKTVADSLVPSLLSSLMTGVSVQVVEQDGRYYIKQEVIYFSQEGAIPYDVPNVSKPHE